MCRSTRVADGQDALSLASPTAQSAADGPDKIERHNKTVTELAENLKSPDGRVVYNAFQELGQLGSKAEPAIAKLVEYLKNPQEAFVVKDFFPPGHILGPSRKFFYAEQARHTLLAIGPSVVPHLLKSLHDKSPALQQNAALVLGGLARDGRLGENVDLEAVKKAVSEYLQNSASKLSVDDLKTIGFTKTPEAPQELILRLQKNTKYETRAWSALALGELKSTEALPALRTALKQDPDYLVRQFSANALGRFDKDDAISGALANALLKDKESSVRSACAKSLKGARSPKAIEALIKSLGDSSAEVRLDAAAVFWQVESKESIPALMKALEKETEYLTRDYILLALAKQNAKEALPLIENILKDESKSVSHDTAQYVKDVLTGKRQLLE